MSNSYTTSFINTFEPRFLPLSIKLSVNFISVYFLLGFIFSLSGSFILLMNREGNYNSSFYLESSLEKTVAVIYEVSSTHSSENKQKIYRYNYHFTDSKEKEYEGVSYETDMGLSQGDQKDVFYKSTDPNISYLSGMRSSLFPIWVMLLMLIFPIVGLSFLLFHFKRARRYLKILKHGLLTSGKVVSKTATSTKINNQLVYLVTFEFTDKQKQTIRAQLKTHIPHVLEDEQKEPVVYIPEAPTEAIMLDALPGNVRKYFEA